MGRKLAFPSVKKHLESRWKLKNPLEIKLEKNMFYIKIEAEELRRSILDAGLVFILGRIFVLQQWSSEVEKLKDRIEKVPVWAKLWDLPKEL